MAENAGHLVQVGVHTAIGGPYVDINGVTSVSVSRDRTVLDITDFADVTASKLKIMGLKDCKIEISGQRDIADAPQAALVSRYDDGASTFIGIEWDGSTVSDGEFKVASFNESADVDGLVTFSCSLEGSPNGGASGVWA